MHKSNTFGHLGHNLDVVYVPLDMLKPYKGNPRTHSEKQLLQIADSMKEFGFTNPILIDSDKSIIAGHGRLESARLIGLDKVPVIELAHLTDAQKRAYIIADNKLAENAGWDEDLLKIEIQGIIELDSDFDLTLTGFEVSEIDLMLEPDDEPENEPPLPSLPEIPVSRPRDLWHLGNHRLYCGDALNQESYEILMGDIKAKMVFTDPPYNVPINGHVCGNGKTKHDEFKMASGEMSEEEFTDFLSRTFSNLKDYSCDGSLHYICMDWRHMRELLDAGATTYEELKNLCVWNKTNGGMGSFYRSKHELVFVYKNGKGAHLNNVELGKNGRYRTNVWDYAGVNTFKTNDDLEMHPTVKPVSMIQDAILDCTRRGDSVLDVFGGSGSTLIAAEQSGRKAFLMELDPKYVDVIIKRFEELTGEKAMHEDFSFFADKKEERHGE